MESFVAEDHFLRRINRVLDLSFIGEVTTARYLDGQGRPSIDPEVYFRMPLVAYFYGLAKDRRLCEEVRVVVGQNVLGQGCSGLAGAINAPMLKAAVDESLTIRLCFLPIDVR